MDDEQEDPGACPYCGESFQIVRPGKSQPNCDCQEEVVLTKHQHRSLNRELELLRSTVIVLDLQTDPKTDNPLSIESLHHVTQAILRTSETMARRRGA